MRISNTLRTISQAIFIDVIAPKGPRAMHKLTRFFSRDHRNTHGYWAKYLFDLHTCNRPVLRSCPERSLQSPLFLLSFSTFPSLRLFLWPKFLFLSFQTFWWPFLRLPNSQPKFLLPVIIQLLPLKR